MLADPRGGVRAPGSPLLEVGQGRGSLIAGTPAAVAGLENPFAARSACAPVCTSPPLRRTHGTGMRRSACAAAPVIFKHLRGGGKAGAGAPMEQMAAHIARIAGSSCLPRLGLPSSWVPVSSGSATQSVSGHARRSADVTSSLGRHQQQSHLLLMVSAWVSQHTCRLASLRITMCQKHVIFEHWDAHKQAIRCAGVSQVIVAHMHMSVRGNAPMTLLAERICEFACMYALYRRRRRH